jgi:photosystem II stability/assembly factor-like uncharacterized protein
MARTPTRPRPGPKARRRPAPRRRQQNRLARNRWWAAVGVGVLAVAVVLVARDPGRSPSEATGAVVGGDLHSLVVDPANPDRVFVGGHQAVATSPDGGRTWRQVPSLQNADAMGWAFTDQAIWVSGHPGLNRSTDGGRRFARANRGLPDTDVHAFGAGPTVLYGSSPSVGVFASADGGQSWQVRSDRAGQGFFGRILVDPADGQHLVAADVQVGVVGSSDGGRSWRRLGASPPALWVSRAGPGMEELIVSGPEGAARSADGGRTWDRLQVPKGAVLVEAAPTPGLVYAAAHRGDSALVWVSRDGGRTWARA